MDNDVHRERQADNSLAILDAMRQWVAEPLERQMASLEQQIRDQQTQTRDQFAAMRDDFRSMLTAMSDSQTGYVPRPEIALKFEGIDQRITAIVTANDQHEAERRVMTRWLVGVTLTVATIVASVVSAIFSFSHH